MFAKVDVGKAPLEPHEVLPNGNPDAPQGEKAPSAKSQTAKQGKLIQHAVHEKPARIDRTWYLSQGLHGLTTLEINSDLPGQLNVRVNRPLMDKFLQGETLVQQHSIVVVRPDGDIKFGQSRVNVTLRQIELPDGSILALKGRVTDQRGAPGLWGKTDYHWGRVIAATGISAVLAIGTQLPFGNQQGFAPTIGQQVSRDVAGGVSDAGRTMVDRELNIDPTITVEPAKYPVIIYPDENVLLVKQPTIIR
jgi:type IV secretory pathway VirB10-like protein